MSPDEVPDTSQTDSQSFANDLPAIEDANTPPEPQEGVVADDDPTLLDSASKALEGDEGRPESDDKVPSEAAGTLPAENGDSDGISDTASIPDESRATQETTEPQKPADWSSELSAHKVVVELKRIEAEIRTMIEARDTKRKRKLSGTRRWLELEEDLITWSHAGRIDEETLHRVRNLIGKRHHLFGRLRFLAGTRPTWNT